MHFFYVNGFHGNGSPFLHAEPRVASWWEDSSGALRTVSMPAVSDATSCTAGATSEDGDESEVGYRDPDTGSTKVCAKHS